jgi:FkbM family methyltransferase
MNLRQFLKFWLRKDTTMKGEFGYCLELLKPDTAKFLIDVGANDGFYGSNSYPFVARGWQCLLIEPHPAVFKKLTKLHENRQNVTCLNLACGENNEQKPLFIGVDGDEGTLATLSTDDNEHMRTCRTSESVMVQVKTLSRVLEEAKAPRNPGILSIDTEGYDLQVLKGLDFKTWRPEVIITEDYYDDDEKLALLKRNGYEFRFQAGNNKIFAKARD